MFLYSWIVVSIVSPAVIFGQTPLTLTTTPIFRNTAQIMQGEVPTPLPVSATPTNSFSIISGTPFIADHFTVAEYLETGQYGPSAESSVGSTQVLVASKGRVRSFSKNGMLDKILNVTLDSFFSPITLGGFTADPNVIFHPHWKRWIIFANAFLHSSLVLAISDGDPITSATVWSFYTIDQIANPGFSPTAFFDYTTLGADAQAIYCAANLLDNNDFVSAAAYVLPKSSLTSSTSATVYAFRNLDSPNQTLRPFTFQPALNFDTTTRGFFPSIDWNAALKGFSDTFLLNIVDFDSQGIPTLSNIVSVPVLPFAVPFTVAALGTPEDHIISPVASFRLAPTHIRDNRLWLVTNIGVDNKGNSSLPVDIPPAGSITRNGVRFTQLDMSELPGSPIDSVVSQGTVFQPSTSNTLGRRSFLTPSIMSNKNGTVLIGATTCAENERLNAAVAQLTTDNLSVGPTVLYTSSSSNYNATEDWEFLPYARWGDHTRISPDPEDPTAFWTAQQWCSNENSWGLEVAHVITRK